MSPRRPTVAAFVVLTVAAYVCAGVAWAAWRLM